MAHEVPHGAYIPIARDPGDVSNPDACEEWLTALNDGGYDYVVIGPDQRTQGIKPAEAFWTKLDPAATQVLSDDLTFVFKLDGELDASTCTRFADVGGDAEVVTGGKTGLLQPSQ